MYCNIYCLGLSVLCNHNNFLSQALIAIQYIMAIQLSFCSKEITLLSCSKIQRLFVVFLLRHFETTVLAEPVFQSALFGP
jgi:hypothetical protein